MKLLLVTEFFPKSKESFSGGVEARMFYLSKFLTNQSHLDLKLIHRHKTNIDATGGSIFSRIVYQFSIIKQIIKLKPEIVEASNVTTYIPAFIGAKLIGAKSVIWLPDVIGRDWFVHFGYLAGLLGFISESVALRLPWDGVIFLSKSTQAKAPLSLQKKDFTKIIYGGFDVQISQSIKPQKPATPEFIVVSRLVNYKQVNLIIKAFAKIINEFPQAKLKIVGQGMEKNNLVKLIKKLNLSENIIFIKPIKSHSKLLQVMADSTALISMSLVEGFGLVVVEALSVGTPYIHSEISVTKEITQNGQGGILVAKDNINQLARAMTSLIEDKKLYLKKVTEGKDLVKQYNWQDINSQTLKFYQKVYDKKI